MHRSSELPRGGRLDDEAFDVLEGRYLDLQATDGDGQVMHVDFSVKAGEFVYIVEAVQVGGVGDRRLSSHGLT